MLMQYCIPKDKNVTGMQHFLGHAQLLNARGAQIKATMLFEINMFGETSYHYPSNTICISDHSDTLAICLRTSNPSHVADVRSRMSKALNSES